MNSNSVTKLDILIHSHEIAQVRERIFLMAM